MRRELHGKDTDSHLQDQLPSGSEMSAQIIPALVIAFGPSIESCLIFPILFDSDQRPEHECTANGTEHA
jgi:hypothetical protein